MSRGRLSGTARRLAGLRRALFGAAGALALALLALTVSAHDDDKPGVPRAPASMPVSVGDGSITIRWNAPLNDGGFAITSYGVQWQKDGEGQTTFGGAFSDVGDPQPYEWTFTSLTNGAKYRVAVRAENSQHGGDFLNYYPVIPGTPNPPGDFRVVRKSDSEAILAWSQPGGNGATVTGYEYEVDPAVGGGNPSWTAFDGDDVALCKDGQGNFTDCYTVSGLSAGTAYEFRMRAVNSRGAGPPTDPEIAATGTLREVGPPGLPRAPASNPVDVGDGSITIRWNAPVDDGGDPIVAYGFQWQKDGDTQTTFAGSFRNLGASQPYEYTRWGFTNGARYRFGVRAENSRFDGEFLNYHDLIPGTPRVPGNFGIALESDGGVTLTWSEPGNNGDAITGYDYAANAVGATSPAWTAIAAADVSKCTDSEGNARVCYTVSGLTTGTAHEFRIRGKNSRGAGPPTDARTGTPRATPDRPVPEHDPSDHDEQALLHWAPPADNGAAITGYQIQQRSRDKSAASWPDWPTAWTDLALGDLSDYTTDDNRIHRSYAVTGLTNGREYEFRIRAVNVAGPSRPACDPCSGSNVPYPTVKASPAGKPISRTPNVRWSAGDRSITVGWTPPDPNGSPLTQYASRVWDHNGDLDDTACVIIPLSAPTSAGDGRLLYEITKTGQVTVTGQDKDCLELLPETSARLEELENGQRYFGELWAFNGEGKTLLNWWVSDIYPRPELSVSDAASAVWEGESASKSLEFTVTQSAPSKRAITVKYRTGDPSDTSLAKATAGGDYTAVSDTTLTFAANATGDDLTQKVTVQAKDDTVDEDDEYLAVKLHTPTDAAIDDGEGIGKIRDDDGLTDICSRTDQVKTAILAATPADEPCQWVDPDELAAITSLTVGPDNDLSALKSGDFAGMTGLEELVVKGNSSLSVLPSDLFAPLSALTDLNLQDNAFTELPAALTGLSASAKGRIDELYLGGNPYEPYPGIALADLTGLDTLDVPTFDDETISDRTWVVGTAISDVTLPAAQWGDTPYTYTLTTDTFPPGLSFDAATRKLTGTPTSAGEHEMTYVVQDNSTPDSSYPDRATLTFTITVGTAEPGPPGDFAAAGGSGEVALTWSPPDHTGASAIIRYEYEQDGGDWTAIANSAPGEANAASWTVADLDNGQTYAFRLRAVNGDGDGAPSGSETAKMAPGRPDAPALAAGSGALTVTWTAPAGDGGSPITAYDLQYRESSASTWTEVDNAWTSGSDPLEYTVSNLTDDTEHEVQVRAVNARGDGDWSATSTATPGVPHAPALPTLTVGDGELEVSWNAPASGGTPAEYDLRHRPTNGTWTTVDPATSGALDHTITSLTNGTAYEVEVRAVNGAGDGPWSDTATGIPATLPGKPAITAVTPRDAALKLEWSAPSNDGGSTITRYDIGYRKVGDVGWVIVGYDWQTGKALSTTIDGLTNGDAYQVTIRAHNGQGDGPWSVTESGTPSKSPPDAPGQPVIAAGDERLTVSWSEPDYDGGEAITAYDVRYRESGASTWTVVDDAWQTGGGNLEYDISNLTNGTAYDVQVRAVNSLGDGAWSATATGTPVTPPDAPAIAALLAADQALTLTWTAPSSDGGSTITAYDVQYRKSSESTWTVVDDAWTSGSDPLEYTISNLVNHIASDATEYDVQVRAVNGEGDGAWSATSTARAGPPGKPAIGAVESGDSRLTVRWSAPTWGGAATSYDLRYRSSGATDWTETTGVWSSGALEYAITSLANGTAYEVEVRAVNGAGNGPWSDTATGTPATVAGKPAITAVTPLDAALKLEWTAPASDGGSTITRYDIDYRKVGDVGWVTVGYDWQPGKALTTMIDGLTNGDAYQVRIRARNGQGDGPWSDTESGTPSKSPPDAPGQPVIAAGDERLTVSWSEPDYDGGEAITAYDVRYRESGASTWTVVDDAWQTGGGNLEYDISNLTNGTAYDVQVRAVNSLGDGAWSATASGTPEEDTSPDFGAGATVPEQFYPPNDPISPLTLPAATGGNGTLVYSLAPALPAGLGFDAAGREISGTPTATTARTKYTLTATDDDGDTDTLDFHITVEDDTAPSFGTEMISEQKYTDRIAITDLVLPAATDGNGTLVYSLAPALPPGLSFDAATRTLSGTPTTIATTSMTYTVTDADDNTATADSDTLTFVITVGANQVPIADAGRDRTVVEGDIVILDGSGSTDPEGQTLTYDWTPPTGVVLGKADEVHPTFIAPAFSSDNDYTFTLIVNDGVQDSATASVTITVQDDVAPSFGSATVSDQTYTESVAITTLTLPDATGGNGDPSYALACAASAQGCDTSTDLPPGLSFDADDRELTGTPGTPGTYPMEYTASDADANTAATDAATLTFTITVDTAEPGPPGNFAAAGGRGEVALTWSPPAHTGASAILRYEYEQDGGSWTAIANSAPGEANAASWTVADLDNGRTYAFRLRAVNSDGDGAPSASVTAEMAPGRPDAPALTAGSRALTVTWTAPAGDGGSAITAYDLRHRESGASTWTTVEDAWQTGGGDLEYTISNLTDDTAHEVQIRAVNARGDGDWSASSTATPGVPHAPARPGLAVGDGKLTATWSAPASGGTPAEYDLRHRPANGTWTTVDPATSGALEHTIENLTNGTAYEVEVRAVNGAGDGPWSDTATGIPATLPGKPAITAVTPRDAALKLEWSAPSNDGGSTITRYDIGYRKVGDVGWVIVGYDWQTGKALSTTIDGLTNGDAYQVTIRAHNGQGDGPWSVTESGTPSKSPPDAPGQPVIAAGDERLTVSWSEPDYDGGEAITAYDVRYRESGASTWTVVDDAWQTGGGNLEYDISNLTNGTAYDVQVRAVNDEGDGAWSATASGMPVAPPDAPVIAALLAADQALTVTWTAPSSDGGSTITAYDVQYRKSGGSTWTVEDDAWSSGSDPLEYTIESLINHTASDDTEYDVQVRAVNDEGDGGWSATSTARAGPPGKPAIGAIESGDGQLSVPWSAPTWGGAATSYDLRYRASGATDWTETTGVWSSGALEYAITNLTNGTDYEVQVRGVNGAVGDWSDTATATPATVPGKPSITTVTAANGTLAVDWSAPSSDGGSAITAYDVQYKKSSEITWTLVDDAWTSGSDPLRYTIESLTNGTVYDIQVRAVNAEGDGAWSDTASGTPANTPGAPSIASLLASDRAMTVAWTAPGSDGGSPITAYDIQYRKSGESTWTVVDEAWKTGDGDLKHTLSNLTNHTASDDTEYDVQVRAVNARGDGAWSATSTARAGPPGKPTIGTIEIGNGQLTVPWSAPAWGGTATEYDLRHRPSGGTWTEVDPAWTSGNLEHSVSGLANGTVYEFQVRGVNGAVGDWSDLATETPATVPGKPSIATVTAANGTLTVAWAAPADNGGAAVTSYDVRYKLNTDTDWKDPEEDVWQTGEALSYTLTGLTNGSSYDVQVRAENRAGEGGWSTKATEAPTETTPGAPDAPSLAVGDGSLAVTWSASADDGGSTITAYDLQYKESTASAWTPVDDVWQTGGGAFEHTIPNLTNGTAYDVQVRAVNAEGDGPWSATASGTPATRPGRPVIGTIAAGNRKLTVPWTAPSSNGGAEIRAYHLVYGVAGTGAWTRVDNAWTPGSGDLEYTLTNLANGTTYDIRVQAENARGLGGWSQAATATPAWLVSIADASVTEGDSGTATLDFTVSLNDTGTTNVTVEFATSDDSDTSEHAAEAGADYTAASGTLTIDAGDLAATASVTILADKLDEHDEVFSVTLSAPTGAVLDAGRAVATGTIVDDDPLPGIVTMPREQRVVETDKDFTTPVTIALDAASGRTIRIGYEDGPGNVEKFRSTRNVDYAAAKGTLEIPPGERSATLDVTILGDEVHEKDVEHVYIYLTSFVSVEEPTDSNDRSRLIIVDDDDSEPTATLHLDPDAIAENGGKSAVTATLGNPSEEPTTITVSATGDTATDNDFTLSATTTLTIAARQTGSTGTVEITAVDNSVADAGKKVTVSGSASNDLGVSGPASVTLAITDDEAPGAPSVTSVTASHRQLAVGWDAPASSGASAITAYDLRYKASTATAWTTDEDVWVTGGGALTYAISALTNGTEYDIQVRAVNAVGDGAWSATATGTPDGAPTADAGADQKVVEGDSVTLDGSGSTDPEGQPLTYAWTAPTGITLSSTTEAKPTFTAPAVSTDTDYTFSLTVSDGVNTSAADEVTVTVQDDVVPSFSAGTTVADQTEVAHIAIADLVLPEATGGNGILTYALACASGQTGCEGTPALPPGLNFDAATRTLSGTPTATGATSMTYTVTDADGDTATLSFTITVNANQAPTADAGAAQTVLEGEDVTLDGSGSSDPEGQPLTYAWTAPTDITLSSTTEAKPTFTAPAVSADTGYTFSLTVSDGVNTSAADSVTITVEDDVAPSFGTETVVDQTYTQSIAIATLTLPNATGGNGTLTYALACASGATGCEGTPASPPGLNFDAVTRTLSGTPTATGTTSMTYTVTDADDDTDTLSFDITVNANQSPTADAGAAQTVLEGEDVTLDGSGSSDPEGQPLTYAWTAPTGITLSDPAVAKPTFTAPAVSADTDYTFSLTVSDGVNTSAAASVIVTVQDDVAPSFGTETVSDQTEVAHIAIANLVLPEATGGNGALTYALACASGQTGCEGTPALPPGLNFDAATRTLSGTPTATGTTSMTYTVTDADDDTDTLGFDITVSANQAPTADAGAAQTVLEGGTVTLDGSGSSDPEGQPLAYTWTAPTGITLSDTAVAKPTFTAPAVSADTDYTFSLTVSDGVNTSAAASVIVTVQDDVAPSFGTETVSGQTYTQSIAIASLTLPEATAGNGTLTYALACASGQAGCEGTPALPPGLNFDAATRTLSGTPTAIATTAMTYTVTDADEDTATLSFTITVDANQAPTADAGAAQTVLEGEDVTLDGSGSSDPEGQTLTYAWTAPTGITLSDTAAAKPTFAAPAVSADTDYSFTLTVNDGVQDSSQVSVTVTVQDNVSPSFGTKTVADQTEVAHIAIADLVLPEATGGNGTLTYALACASGATGCEGTPALPPGLNFDAATRTLSGTPTATGTTSMTYTVTDADDDTDMLGFDITVNANQSPTADAGAAQTVLEGEDVTLDGSGSSDPEGQTLTYTWTAPTGITLSDPAVAKPTFTAPAVSADTDYSLTLTVNDGVQDSSQVSVTVTVQDNVSPSFGTKTVADQTEVAHIAIADLVLPEATGGNGTLTYALACASGATGCEGTPALPPGLNFDAATRTLSGTPTAIATTAMTYTVTDADADTDTLGFDITVNANQSPTADAGAAQTVLEGEDVTLDGSGSSDPEGQTLTYTWTAPTGITLSDPAVAKPTFTAPTVSSDTVYTFSLSVSDGVNTSAADEVKITVEDDGAPSFGAETVADQTYVAHIAVANLVLPEATGGNGALTYALACASGATGCEGTPALPSGLSFDAATRTLSGTPTATGTTSMTYTVTDADDDTDTLAFDITVNANQSPTADAGAAQTVLEGEDVTLDGSGSSDPEGQPLTYAWTAPTDITLSSTTEAKPTFTAPAVSADTDYTFSLTVSDGVNTSAAASVIVTVQDDVAPSFGTETVADQTYVAHIAIADLGLPEATGGNGALTYALVCATDATGCTGTPALPPGLSFDAATRTLSGTPTATGTTSMTYTVTDADADTDTLGFDITVNANQSPTADAGAAQTVLEGEDVTLDGSGSSDPEGQPLTYTWTAPTDITLSSTTEAKPTFTAPAVSADTGYTFSLTVSDGVNTSAADSVTITVEDDGAPSFGTETVADQTYTQSIAIATLTLPEATGGNGMLTYALACASGATGCDSATELPPGLSFDAATRNLGGTPTATGATSMTYTVTDADGDSATLSFTITVNRVPPDVPVVAIQTPVPITEGDSGTRNLVFTVRLSTASPNDVTMDFTTADVTATAGSDYAASRGTLTIPAGQVNAMVGARKADPAPTMAVPVIGDMIDEPDETFVMKLSNVSSNALLGEAEATGTIVDDDGAGLDVSTRRVTVPENGTAEFDLRLATQPSNEVTVTVVRLSGDDDLSIRQGTSLTFTTATWADAQTVTLEARDDPDTDHGTATFRATSASSDPNYGSLTTEVTATEADDDDLEPGFAGTESNRRYTVGRPIRAFTLPAGSGGDPPLSYRLTSIPHGLAGLTFTASARRLSGTPATAGTYNLTYTVSDAGGDTATLTFRIVVAEPPAFAETVNDQAYTEGRGIPGLVLPRASGGTAPLTYTLAPLPSGLVFDGDPSRRRLAGTPDGPGSATLTYMVTDANGATATLAFRVVVAEPPAFAETVNDRTYTEGKEIPGLVLPRASGGTAPLTYTLAPLPSGLVFDGDPSRRRLAGTPDGLGSTTLTYTVTDAHGATATLAFRIVVEADAAPLFAPEPVDNLKPQHYIAGNAVNLRLPVLTLGNGTNAEHRYEWTGSDGRRRTLPEGLSLERGDPASLAVTGTPTERMVSTEYTLTVADRDGDTTALSLHIAVIEIMDKPPGSEVTFDEETGEMVVRHVRFRSEGRGLSTAEAARMALPAGHMVSGLALRVANLVDDGVMPPDPGTLFGVVALHISSDGTLAGGKASVCLSTDGMPQGKAPRLYHEDPASGVWIRIDTEIRTEVGLICGDVSALSKFGVGYEAETLPEVRKRALEHVLAAFGRTVATDAVSVLSDRMEHASRDGTGSGITLAGRALDLRATMPAHDGMRIRTGGERETAARNGGGWRGSGGGGADPWADPAGSESLISERELLTGTSFRLTLGAEDDGTGERAGFAGGRATLWGGGRTAGFEGLSEEGFALDGDVVSGWLGVDWHRRDLLLGLAISHSRGEMDYRDADAINRDGNAEIELDTTSVHPYARWSLDDGLDVWGILGVGAGNLKLVDGFGGNVTDIGMRMAAAGVRRALGSWSEHGIDFAVKTDALAVVMRSDPRGLDSPGSADNLPGANVSAQRVRLALEGGYTRELESHGLVRSTLELGARHDRGGAETGAGVDLAGVVRYEDPSRGLTVEGGGRVMLAHEAKGFEEWGAGGAIRLSPDGNGRGLSFSVEPSWGVAASGAERLWNDGVPAGADDATRRGRVEAELGYGLGGPGGRGLLTPYVAAGVTAGQGQDYGVGVRFRLGPGFELDVDSGYRESGDGEAAFGAGLQLVIAF